MDGKFGKIVIRVVVFFVIFSLAKYIGSSIASSNSRKSEPKTAVYQQENDRSESNDENPYQRVTGNWGSSTVDIDGMNIHPYYLDLPLYDCDSLLIDFDLEMKYGTHCENWRVYAQVGSTWKDVGSFHVPGGNGRVQDYVFFDRALDDVNGILMAPEAYGSFSWNSGLAIYEIG